MHSTIPGKKAWRGISSDSETFSSNSTFSASFRIGASTTTARLKNSLSPADWSGHFSGRTLSQSPTLYSALESSAPPTCSHFFRISPRSSKALKESKRLQRNRQQGMARKSLRKPIIIDTILLHNLCVSFIIRSCSPRSQGSPFPQQGASPPGPS